MLKLIVAAILLLTLATLTLAQEKGQNWAVLISGSNEYYNYRHQSDVCHTFQLLKRLGIPESNIIVMMYDDIANNNNNPRKGTIINCPGCPNVYPGVPKDYVGKQVTAENFQKVLRGELPAGGSKTLKSGPNDNVFIYFTDHGGPGLIAMPAGPFLYAKDLISTLKYMHDNKRYNKLVFYMEACESGSMFNNLLPADWNIFAVTASNPFQSSYACDYDSTYRTYLNDCWSINWMNDTETHSNTLKTYTLQEQFDNVKKMTTQSPACAYGDLNIAKQPVADFQGSGDSRRTRFGRNNNFFRGHATRMESREVKTEWLKKQAEQANSPLEMSKWMKYLKEHEQLKSTYDMIWSTFQRRLNLQSIDQLLGVNAGDRCHDKKAVDSDCMKSAVEAAERACGKFREESLKFTHLLNDACDKGYNAEQMEDALNNICAHVSLPFTTQF